MKPRFLPPSCTRTQFSDQTLTFYRVRRVRVYMHLGSVLDPGVCTCRMLQRRTAARRMSDELFFPLEGMVCGRCACRNGKRNDFAGPPTRCMCADAGSIKNAECKSLVASEYRPAPPPQQLLVCIAGRVEWTPQPGTYFAPFRTLLHAGYCRLFLDYFGNRECPNRRQDTVRGSGGIGTGLRRH